MKTKSLIVTAILTLGIITSCQEENSIEQIDLFALEQEYLATLPTDFQYQNFTNSLKNLSEVRVYQNVDLNELKIALESATNDDEIIEVINSSFESPDEVITKLRTFEKSVIEFKSSHESFYKLDISQRENVLMESMNIDLILSDNSNARVNGECEDQRDNDKQTCAEGSYVAAAGCGLLSPTLVGALACGAFVIAADVVCHRAAERDYETCKQYQS